MSFFTIISAEEISYGSNPMKLKVVQGSGVEVNPDLEINVTNLNNGNRHFLNNGYGGINFKIDVIIKKDEVFPSPRTKSNPIVFKMVNNMGVYTGGGTSVYYENTPIIDKLHEWIISMTPLYVVTDAIDIPNGRYIIKNNSTRKQSYNDYTVWNLEFAEFKGLNITKYANNNKYVNKAKKNYAKAKKKARKANANATLKNKLKKCKVSDLKYGAKKSKCVKYMQKVLYKKGFLKKKEITTNFDKKTKSALKQFQKKYKKKYKLTANGKVDKATLKALINV